MRKLSAVIILSLSLALLAINVYGMFWGEYPQPDRGEWDMGADDRTLYELTVDDLAKKEEEGRAEYFVRLTETVDRYFIHYGPGGADSKYIFSPPIWENWLLWLYTKIIGENSFIEPYDAVYGLKRGFGMCSLHSLIIVDVLDRNNIPARVIRLEGHVVAAGQLENADWQILDGNYGVVIPYEISQLETNPRMVWPFYEDVYQKIPNAVQLPMVEIYGPEGNSQRTALQQKGWKAYYLEMISRYLIWMLPLFLIAYSLWLLRTGFRGKAEIESSEHF